LVFLGKKTLVFDLDETLIHCNENSNIPSDVVLPIKFPTGEIIEVDFFRDLFIQNTINNIVSF